MKKSGADNIQPQWINPSILIVDIKGSNMTTLQDRFTPRDTTYDNGSFTKTSQQSTVTRKTLSIKRP